MEELNTEADEPHVKIVRPSSRRKFLTVILGSGVILGLGAPALMHMVQNFRVSFNAKDGPSNNSDHHLSYDSFSPDLNLMAMVNGGQKASDPNIGVYIWNFQQQHRLTLPAGVYAGTSAWSPDSRYLLYQAIQTDKRISLDVWDIRARQKVSSYTDAKFAGADIVYWSPDGSKIALYSKDQNQFLLLAARPLQPLFTLEGLASVEAFTWSPDSQRIAFVIGSPDRSAWSIQIWDLPSRRKSQEIAFQGKVNFFYSNLAWSPDGTHIVTLAHGQLRLFQAEGKFSSEVLDENLQGLAVWSPDSKHLVTVGSEGADDRGWDTPSFGSRFDVWSTSERRQVWSHNRGTNSIPHALGWSSDGRKIIIIDTSDAQEIWDWP